MSQTRIAVWVLVAGLSSIVAIPKTAPTDSETDASSGPRAQVAASTAAPASAATPSPSVASATPAPTPEPLPRPPQLSLQDRVRELARALWTKNSESGGDDQLASLAASLSSKERAELSRLAIDASARSDERTVAVYLLTQALPESLPLLFEVVRSPVPVWTGQDSPHSLGSVKHQREVTLRIAALEAIDRLETNDVDVLQGLQKTVNSGGDESVRWLAQVALAGRESNQKGKLVRFMSEVLNKNGSTELGGENEDDGN